MSLSYLSLRWNNPDWSALTLQEAEEIVDSIDGWVGLDEWKAHPVKISLDGHFTVDQLAALVVMLKHLKLG